MGATLSSCGKYRFHLNRDLGASGEGDKTILFVMLNPSTADASIDDPTIRKLRGFAQRLGYRKISVVNLFAYRATDPKQLKKVADPVGEGNLGYVEMHAELANLIVCAWGTGGTFNQQNEKTLKRLCKFDLYALEITKGGHPKHPLYVSYEKEPILWKPAQ